MNNAPPLQKNSTYVDTRENTLVPCLKACANDQACRDSCHEDWDANSQNPNHQ